MVFFGASIDYVAVIAATVVAFIFGIIWYAPPLLGKYWIERSKLGNSEKAGMGKTLGSAIISSFLMAFIIEVFFMALHISRWTSAIELAALIWVGFYFTKEFASMMSGDKSMKAFASLMVHDGIALLLIVATLFVLH